VSARQQEEPVAELRLAAGVTARVRRVPGAPVVAMRLLLPGGLRHEPAPGVALVTGRMLAEGTARRDWRRWAEALEDRGMILSTAGTTESLVVGLDALAEDWATCLDWLAELALEPSFPADRCAWLQRQAAAELESQLDQPETLTAQTFARQLYTPHPRSRSAHGSLEDLAAIEVDTCRTFHRQCLERGVILALTGDLDLAAVEPALVRRFAGGERRQQARVPSGDQAHLYLGHLTVPRAHPDFPALEVLAVILGSGAGLSGRIPYRIREQEGLAYSVQAQTVSGAGLDPGRFVAYVATSPTTVAQAERGIVEELERLLADGVTEAEVTEAKAYLMGRWAEILAEATFYGLPSDDAQRRLRDLAAIDRPQVEAAARKHLHPAELKVTVGLP
jgi:zinc protease